MIPNSSIKIYEVGPRDGIQIMPHVVGRKLKRELIESLVSAGLTDIEVGSFVHPKLVPNMADSDKLFEEISHLSAHMGVLIPNHKGLDRAMKVGAEHFNIFYSPISSFNTANHGKTYNEVLSHYRNSLTKVSPEQVRVYLSMAFSASRDELEKAVKDGLELGSTIVLCDTDGTASQDQIYTTVKITQKITKNIALHLHSSTRMMGHVEMAYEHLGIREFDCSIGGMGGCPFVEGSQANLATEVMVQWCDERGIHTGVDLNALQPALDIVKKIKSHPALNEPCQ